MLPSHIIEFKLVEYAQVPITDVCCPLISSSSNQAPSTILPLNCAAFLWFTVYRKNRGCLVLHCLYKEPRFLPASYLAPRAGYSPILCFSRLLEIPPSYTTSRTTIAPYSMMYYLRATFFDAGGQSIYYPENYIVLCPTFPNL